MMATTIQPRVYVACLASYNNAMLHGVWIDADQDVDDIWAEINAMLAESPVTKRYGEIAEEWAIHDHEYMGKLSEYESIENVARIGALVAEHGEAMLAFLKIIDSDDELDDFQERFCGEWESERDYAYHYVGELGLNGIAPETYVVKDDWSGRSAVNPLEALNGYLDWDQVAQSLFDHGDHTYADGYVFRDNC